MKLQHNVDLGSKNTLGVPSIAEHFVACENVIDLCEARQWARDKKIQVINILGGGSNILCAERVLGLTLHPQIKGIQVVSESDEHVELQVGAGENWHEFVTWTISHRFYGLENLAYIPGSVGAAPIQNIGAYGVEVEKCIVSVNVLSIESGEVSIWSHGQCDFGYRDSIFKKQGGGQYVIVSVNIRLLKSSKVVASYPALKDYLSQQGLEGTPENIFQAVIAIRQAKLPEPRQIPNAGSFFKNPIVECRLYDEIKQRFPSVIAYDAGKGKKKLAAGWLIDHAGLKGTTINGVVVHEKQALVLGNPLHLSRTHILSAASEIQHKIQKIFHVSLEIEPQLFG